VQLEVSDRQPSDWVNADAIQIERVLTNLISNAINYARRDGEVKVIITTAATELTVQVVDDGASIPVAELQQVFNRFYQGESDRHGMGLGLTLYLCRQIIQAHNGIIWAENLVPRGVLFGFRIPCYD
jgi:two-component system NarL family sensor kinase